MKLRPHHALCIQKFTGHGYDENFTRHMTQIVRRLKERPDTQVDIISGCDDLCAHCPNCVGGACVTLEKVAEMDRAVLDCTGLREGEAAAWGRLADLARGAVFETEKFEAICKNCQWYELCLNTKI